MSSTFAETGLTRLLLGPEKQSLLLNRNYHKQKRRTLCSFFATRRSLSPSLSNGLFSTRAPLELKTRAVVSGSIPITGEESSTLEKDPMVIHLFRTPIRESAAQELLKLAKRKISTQIVDIRTEHCFNIGLNSGLSSEKLEILKWLLGETYEPENLQSESFIEKERHEDVAMLLVEVGPRLSFTTTWSANAVSICQSCNLTEVTRMERSRRYLLYLKPGSGLSQETLVKEFAALVHDRMIECVYPARLRSFEINIVPEVVIQVPVMERGRKALQEINEKMGLAFDEQDLDYYTRLFRDEIKRDLTTVELFDIAQSNSEHSRHWFFNGKLVIDGKLMSQTLMQIVKGTLKANPNNSVIGFKDNSSAIRGFLVNPLRPVSSGLTSPLCPAARELDILFTAETHNFPCAVAPYPGAGNRRRWSNKGHSCNRPGFFCCCSYSRLQWSKCRN